jgi:hypothetical protein
MTFNVFGLLLGVALIILGGIRVGNAGRRTPYVSLILIGGLFVVLAVLRISGVPIGE